MKKQIVRFFVLLVLIVVLIASLFYLKSRNSNEISSDNLSDQDASLITMFDIDKDDITAFSYTNYTGDMLSFHKENNSWVFDFDESLEIDTDKIENILPYITTLKVSNIITDREVEEFGLSNPACYISVSTDEYKTDFSFAPIYPNIEEKYLLINSDSTIIYVSTTNMTDIINYEINDLIVIH